MTVWCGMCSRRTSEKRRRWFVEFLLWVVFVTRFRLVGGRWVNSTRSYGAILAGEERVREDGSWVQCGRCSADCEKDRVEDQSLKPGGKKKAHGNWLQIDWRMDALPAKCSR